MSRRVSGYLKIYPGNRNRMATDMDLTAFWLSLGAEFSNVKALVSDMALMYSRRYGKSHKKTREAYRLRDIVSVDLASDLDSIVCGYYPMDVTMLPDTQIPLTSVFYRTFRRYPYDQALFTEYKPYPKYLTEEHDEFVDFVYGHVTFFSDFISSNKFLLDNARVNYRKHLEDIQDKFDQLYA